MSERCPKFREQSWQIGSGPTESHCKTGPQRLKGRGHHWDAPIAEADTSLAPGLANLKPHKRFH